MLSNKVITILTSSVFSNKHQPSLVRHLRISIIKPPMATPKLALQLESPWLNTTQEAGRGVARIPSLLRGARDSLKSAALRRILHANRVKVAITTHFQLEKPWNQKWVAITNFTPSTAWGTLCRLALGSPHPGRLLHTWVSPGKPLCLSIAVQSWQLRCCLPPLTIHTFCESNLPENRCSNLTPTYCSLLSCILLAFSFLLFLPRFGIWNRLWEKREWYW